MGELATDIFKSSSSMCEGQGEFLGCGLQYVKDVDEDLARDAIRAVGQIAVKVRPQGLSFFLGMGYSTAPLPSFYAVLPACPPASMQREGPKT